MPRHPLTASERRGILIVAILSLLISGAGIGVSYCGRQGSGNSPSSPEILYEPGIDSGANRNEGGESETRKTTGQKEGEKKEARNKGERKNRGKSKKDSVRSKRNKKAPKVYPRRSLRDEPV